MYPDLNKIEQSHDKAPSGSIGISFAVPSDFSDDAKRRLLELGIDSVRALKGFIAEYDRVKGERDQLERQMTGSLGEVETLRNQVQQLTVQRDKFTNTLSTVTSQMEAVVRKAQHLIDAHISDRNHWYPALRNGKEGRLQAENAPARPPDPLSMPQAPNLADFMAKVLATPADPSSMPGTLAEPRTPFPTASSSSTAKSA
jgi:hypothetical protein